MLEKLIKFIRIIFDMDASDADKNYSKYSRRYNSYKS